MTNQTFELELRMSEDGIVCNAQTLLAMLPAKLKPYSYIVDKENYKKAKEDRAKLNSLITLLKDERMEFERREIGQWLETKETLMRIEKTIKEVADDLGSGVKGIDEQSVAEKKERIRQSFEVYATSNNLDERIKFDYLYDDKEFSKKAMTEDKILAKMQDKLNQIKNELSVVCALLEDEDRVILEDYYYQTYDLIQAKAKFDDFKVQQQRINARKQEVIEEPKVAQNEPIKATTQVTFDSINTIHVMTATMEAPREFFDEMNGLVKKYKAKVKVTSRYTKEV